jgi:hypothetical protein
MDDEWGSVRNQLMSMDAYVFENFVSDLWRTRGWKTAVTEPSNDGGIDVIAIKDDPFPQKQIIQAKCYSSGNKVSSKEVQQYSSLKQQVEGVDSVIIVTTSSFTSQAEDLASKLNVKLIDGDSLLELLSESKDTGIFTKYSISGKSSSNKSPASTNISNEEKLENKIREYYKIRKPKSRGPTELLLKFTYEDNQTHKKEYGVQIAVDKEGDLTVFNPDEHKRDDVLNWAKKSNLKVLFGEVTQGMIVLEYPHFPHRNRLMRDILKLLEIAYGESPEIIEKTEVDKIQD